MTTHFNADELRALRRRQLACEAAAHRLHAVMIEAESLSEVARHVASTDGAAARRAFLRKNRHVMRKLRDEGGPHGIQTTINHLRATARKAQLDLCRVFNRAGMSTSQAIRATRTPEEVKTDEYFNRALSRLPNEPPLRLSDVMRVTRRRIRDAP